MNIVRKTGSLVLIAILSLSVLFTGCSKSGAELQVENDLEAMRDIELDAELMGELENILSDEGKEYFGKFQELAASYEYDIIDTRENEESGGDEDVVVTVRIRTYSFGREYLKAWNEYLETIGDGEFNQADFYELLMSKLGSLDSKGYYSDVEITCTENEDGEDDEVWSTDAASNSTLRNAILGGMLWEIAALAQE